MTATIQVQEQRSYTPEEYLALEEVAEYKSEYHNGQIIPMTGGSTNHNRIALNLSVALSIALKGQEYDVFIGDVRLWMPKKQIYTYPDVMLIEGKPEYYNRRTDTITNPQIIVEVLSKSTKAYDPGDKFRSYRTIPTFQEYILIEQTEIFIEQYSKTDNNKWSLSEYAAEDKMLELTSLQIQISLADIYNKVDFAVGD